MVAPPARQFRTESCLSKNSEELFIFALVPPFLSEQVQRILFSSPPSSSHQQRESPRRFYCEVVRRTWMLWRGIQNHLFGMLSHSGEERRHRWLSQDACQLLPHTRHQVNPGCGKMSCWGRLDGWKNPESASLGLVSGPPWKATVLGDQRPLLGCNPDVGNTCCTADPKEQRGLSLLASFGIALLDAMAWLGITGRWETGSCPQQKAARIQVSQHHLLFSPLPGGWVAGCLPLPEAVREVVSNFLHSDPRVPKQQLQLLPAASLTHSYTSLISHWVNESSFRFRGTEGAQVIRGHEVAVGDTEGKSEAGNASWLASRSVRFIGGSRHLVSLLGWLPKIS